MYIFNKINCQILPVYCHILMIRIICRMFFVKFIFELFAVTKEIFIFASDLKLYWLQFWKGEMMKSYDRLLKYSIKPSMQRIAIMEYLMEHRTHPSADEIYTALSPSMPTLSKTTVYNTLKLFSEQGAALMLTIDERNSNF